MDTTTTSLETNLPDDNDDAAARAVSEPNVSISENAEKTESFGEQISLRVLNEMNERIETLASLLEESNRLSMERERIIDRLHQENQSLKQRELQHALLPVLRDSIRLFDDLNQTANNYAARENFVPANVARDFQCFAETVSDILYRYGLERYTADKGSVFNSKEHRVLGVVQTPEKEKDRTIARIIHEGFRRDLSIIRLLEAEVYRYVPDAAVENNPPASTSQEPISDQ